MILLGLIIIDNQVKAEFPFGKENLRDIIIEKILSKIPPNNHRKTLTQKDIEFHYKREGTLTIFCVASTDTKKRLCWNFIDEVSRNYNPQRVKEILKSAVNKWNDDSISTLNEKIDEVKEIMVNNIEKIIDRGEKLEDLVTETEKLSKIANEFNGITSKVKKRFCCKVFFLMILLIFIVLAIIVVVVFATCGFPKFERCLF
jgi:vesicle-associated membrane protein 7